MLAFYLLYLIYLLIEHFNMCGNIIQFFVENVDYRYIDSYTAVYTYILCILYYANETIDIRIIYPMLF